MAIKSDIKGKKKHTNNPSSVRYKKYKISGDKIVERARHCPRCGPGIFLATGLGRFYCGRCHYTEFEKRKAPATDVMLGKK